MNFEFLEHTGDIKFKAYGKTLDKVFENCALAISSVFSKGKKIKTLKKKKLSLFAKDYESLLYKFAEELIYMFDADNFVVSKAEVKIKDKTLKATIYGDDSSKYKDLDAIKSPTYAEMYVKEINGIWTCQIVLDV